MPRAVKSKANAAVPVPKKKSKLYSMPEKINEGTLLTDLTKTQWRIGASIGTGGFGEIYSACRVGEKAYDYVVKCEPHGNGPLFVEMHFYMRNAKLDEIKRFMRERGLKALGMPHMIGNGSADINGLKHRFIVMPRYGSDVAKHFLANGRRLPEGTVYRLALQMLDVYEYIHSCGYVHADLKAANILLGYGKGGNAQAYLVDYGLASHYTTKDFKPDPKKMHNGTAEYTSRDAHQGVPTRRADFEILAYNLVEWLGGQLPWVKEKLLLAPVKVQKSKEEFMSDVSANLKKVFDNAAPAALVEFFKYVAKMEYNELPDYSKCRQIFLNALKTLKIPHSGDLDFKLKSTPVKNTAPSTSRAVKGKIQTPVSPEVDSSVEIVCASEDDDDDVVFEKRNARRTPTNRTLKTTMKKGKLRGALSPRKASPLKPSPRRAHPNRISPQQLSPAQKLAMKEATPSPTRSKLTPTESPAQKKPKLTTKDTPSNSNSDSPHSAATSRPRTRSTPVSAKANINFSPAISVSRSTAARPGKTIINDNLTPNPRAGKTYEFNFELDVSMDANVVVNVNRKRKPLGVSTQAKEHARRAEEEHKTPSGSPVTRIKVRKLASEVDAASPRTPAVTVKKSRRVVSPR